MHAFIEADTVKMPFLGRCLKTNQLPLMWGCLKRPEASAESNGVPQWSVRGRDKPEKPRAGLGDVPYAMAVTSPCWALELNQDQHWNQVHPPRGRSLSLGRLPKHPHDSTMRSGRC